MMRKFVAATASAALCLMSITPAMAQNYRFSGFDAPRGATATANLVVPLGTKRSKASYGLTLGYGHTMAGPELDGRTTSRTMKFADIRFADGFKLQKAEVATFNLANLGGDRRMKMMGDGDNSTWIVVGLVAAGVAVCLLADCFGGDDDDDDNED